MTIHNIFLENKYPKDEADNDDIRRATVPQSSSIISMSWQSRVEEDVDKKDEAGRSPSCEHNPTYPGSFYPP